MPRSLNLDFSGLQSTVDQMRQAAIAGNASELADRDLQFHLELCRIAGNTYLLKHALQILPPFFAFVRLILAGRGTSLFQRDLEVHQRIVDLIGEGEGEVAEEYVKRAMIRFTRTACDNWISYGK